MCGVVVCCALLLLVCWLLVVCVVLLVCVVDWCLLPLCSVVFAVCGLCV